MSKKLHLGILFMRNTKNIATNKDIISAALQYHGSINLIVKVPAYPVGSPTDIRPDTPALISSVVPFSSNASYPL